MTLTSIERQWYVFARLPSGETLVPGETEGCSGPDPWDACPVQATGKVPACAGASWFYGPEPALRAHISGVSTTCPLIALDPLRPTTLGSD